MNFREYLNEAKPTRMALDNEIEKLMKTGLSVRKATMELEKRYKIKKLDVRNDGTVVGIDW